MTVHGSGSSLIVLAVSVLIGGLAIHVGARLALASRDFTHALLTAGIGGIAWTVVSIVFDATGAPGQLGSLVGLVVWVAVIRWRYGVGWVRAALVGVGAWIAALVVLAVLSMLGIGGLDAYGVPRT